MKRPLQLWLVLLLTALTMPAAVAGLFDSFGNASKNRVLEADDAFQLMVSAIDPLTIEARWIIAPGYYLYREKFKLDTVDARDVAITATDIPPGQAKEDPYFGVQQVFYDEAVATATLQRTQPHKQTLQLAVHYQGCAEIGVCYPPLRRTVAVDLAALPSVPTTIPDSKTMSPPDLPDTREAEQDRLARLLSEQKILAIPAFFGFGVLLAFTPCVFPMIPILSSLIAGQGASLTRRRSIGLSLVYVLAMAVTYTIAGVLAALLGQNIQAWFQNPWAISLFSGLFVLLALSMFGIYDLQLPMVLQQRLTEWSNRQRGGQYFGVAIMGVLSALIIGPCVAPPLIGALSFIAITGDILLGGAALFALSMGMGAPLLLIGASAGHWLPHAGRWMVRIKAVFGVLLLAVALWLLERILPTAVIMLLWAMLFIVTATFMGAMQPLVYGTPGWRILLKGLATVLLAYGILLLVGTAAGGRDPWQPLRGVSLVSAAAEEKPSVPLFRPIKTVADLEQMKRQAGGRIVMLVFYADWCVSCKELERETFADPAVQTILRKVVALQADVTANDAADRALLRHFGLIGPPAILLFKPGGKEYQGQRIVGFVDAETLKKHVLLLLGAAG